MALHWTSSVEAAAFWFNYRKQQYMKCIALVLLSLESSLQFAIPFHFIAQADSLKILLEIT